MASKKWKKKIDSDPRSFRRLRGSKVPAKAILIVTEGEVTEPVYFDALKRKLNLLTVEIEVVGTGKGDPRRLAEAALEERRKRRSKAEKDRISYSQAPDFDEVWIVFDSDVPAAHGRYDSGVAFAKANGVKCAQSTPCFEYWLLLHKQFTTAVMPRCTDVIQRVTGVIGSKYAKACAKSAMMVPPMIASLDAALNGAAQVRAGHVAANTPLPANPSTDVDLLVKSLQSNITPANG